MNAPAQVTMIELPYEAFGARSALHPTLIRDDKHVILIDTGMSGKVGQLRDALAELGVTFDMLTSIILTHQDLDHVGGAADILRECSGRVTVYAHGLDKPYIEGRFPLIKTSPQALAQMASALPEHMRQDVMKSMEYAPIESVDRTLDDNERLPFCGGITVIHTPGHTAGHISLYLEESKTLIAADALTCKDGVLHGPVRQTTLDMETAILSIRKLLDYEIDKVICYHGGLCSDNVQDQLKIVAEQR
ncbi:MBL fold metallo-hydrolase [Cohnella cholangitidis]|uniref:MBL fold metallo-hydrolase n=1 Tax=Cohnella cholangitidis TaxID=2598458 RepID=A0A7G5BTL9_9BACL|nr:MBL fold metallo-hydrolase [Cohnella cholangitidis]QMV40303.1 MBL fold metallo-hydrolase [Cohnella cholangitidis]